MSIIPWDKVDPNESPFVRLFSLIGIPFAAGLINFVVLTAAASSCNSGISNSRMLFGLSEQNKRLLYLKVLTNKVYTYRNYSIICVIIGDSIIKLYFSKCNASIYICYNNFNSIIYYRVGFNYLGLY